MRGSTGWDGRRTGLPDADPSAARHLVVLVGLGVALASTGLASPAIGSAVRASVCGDGPASCAADVIPPTRPDGCRVLSHADPVTEDTVIFTDDLGSSNRLTLSRTVDKNGIVHWFVRQDGGTGVGLEGRSRELLALGGGQVTEFASELQAREFLLATQHQPVKDALAGMDPAGVLARVGDAVDGHTLRPQPPDAYFVQGAGGLDLAAQAQAAVAGPEDGALSPAASGTGLAGLAEVKIDQGAGRGTTVYLWLTGSAGAGLGLFPAGSGLAPAAPGRTLASIGYDENGNPEQLTVEAAGALPARLGPEARPVPDVLTGLLTPGPGVDEDRFLGRVVLTVSLTDRDLLDLAADALHELGVAELPDAGRPPGERSDDGSTAVQRLYRAVDDGTEGTAVTVNTYRVAGDARPEVTLGLQGGLTVSGATPTADYFYAAGQGFVKWRECAG